MWKPWQWAVSSNQRAVANARIATTECSRRRLERADVALYLATMATTATPAVSTKHPA